MKRKRKEEKEERTYGYTVSVGFWGRKRGGDKSEGIECRTTDKRVTIDPLTGEERRKRVSEPVRNE